MGVPINHGYRYLGDVQNRWLSTCGSADTENIGNLGKLKDAVTLKRSILTAIPDIEGRDFYPLLAKVGNTNMHHESCSRVEQS